MKRFVGVFVGVGLLAAVLGRVVFAVSGQTTMSATVECSYLSKPIIVGKANNPVSVVRLQYFLKEYEEFGVEPTGTYDMKTIEAVYRFQSRYRADILVPWGLSKSTGDVSVTTLHKINEIYCGTGPVFSDTEKAQMSAIKKRYELGSTAGILASTTASSTLVSGHAEKGRVGSKGIAVGFMNFFALPILLVLCVLLPTQVYYMWGLVPHRKAKIIPRVFE
jgi:hypothetical protein